LIDTDHSLPSLRTLRGQANAVVSFVTPSVEEIQLAIPWYDTMQDALACLTASRLTPTRLRRLELWITKIDLDMLYEFLHRFPNLEVLKFYNVHTASNDYASAPIRSLSPTDN
jgi:hypothetical protein